MGAKVVIAVLSAFILFIGMNNISATKQARQYESELNKANAEIKRLKGIESQVAEGTCLPRLADMDKKLGLTNG